ncbi:MAG: hypothetical protein EXR95_04880 [Gemmatimonadetes bacterium]|nr:hypothetical protein [Gemmatimonadota bacterium]
MIRDAIRDGAAGVGFARSWLSGHADVVARAIELDRGDRMVPATLLVPARARPRPLPAWIMLHGVTVPGRQHAQLVRFSRAVAHSGAAVVVPEVPEWKDLRLAPELTVPTVRAAVPALHDIPEVERRPVGLIGFSFGAPHAVAAGANLELALRLRLIAAFGGYCDLARTLRFLFLGEHDWAGRRYQAVPDPYGRWIVAGNYLRQVPGYEDAGDVERALLALAVDAGVRGVPSMDPAYDPLKLELAQTVASERRALFDLIAPPAGHTPDRAAAEALMEGMVRALRKSHPEMDPAERLTRVRVPVRLVHGHADVLLPFTESLRMAELMKRETDVSVTITRLFAHSEQEAPPRGLRLLAEQMRFVRAVGRVLRMA